MIGPEFNPRDEEQPTREEWDEYEDERGGGCYECGGRGWVVRCIDDLCHGEDICIHGDPPGPCFSCNRDGKKEDS